LQQAASRSFERCGFRWRAMLAALNQRQQPAWARAMHLDATDVTAAALVPAMARRE